MGTTINSIQLYAGQSPPEQLHSNAVTVLRDYMRTQGYTEAPGTVTILIASNDNNRWASVYFDMLSLSAEALTAQLSRALTCSAIDVNLFDSDVIALTLYENGQKTDTFSNWINYEEDPPETSGEAQKWRGVLPDGKTIEALAENWEADEGDYPFEAEAIWERVADLLEIDPHRAWYTMRDPVDELEGARITGLHFKRNRTDDRST